jgi:uncharacterized Tic20 family protein
MTEPPRPSGEGDPGVTPPHPTSPPPGPGSYSTPGEAAPPGYPPAPPYGTPGTPPPGAGYPPPPGQGYPPPGAGYPPPGHGYPPPGAGYPPPPGAGYPPPGGYYAGGGVPVGYANNDEKTWALLAHFGGIVVSFIAPLIAMLAKGNESPTVRAHAVEALNFQITWAVATVIASVLAVCSFGFLFFLPLLTLGVVIVFSVIAGIRANEGVLYRYPVTVRLVK